MAARSARTPEATQTAADPAGIASSPPERRVEPNETGSPLRGFVDEPGDGELVHPAHVVVRGWHAWLDSPVLVVAVEVDGRVLLVSPGNSPRPDVAEAEGEPALMGAGWRVDLDLLEQEGEGDRGPRAEGVGDDAGDGASGAEKARAGDAPAIGKWATTQPASVQVTVWGAADEPPVRLPPRRIILSLDAGFEVEPVVEPPRLPLNGKLDSPAPGTTLPRDRVPIVGWALSEDSIASTVEVIVDGRPVGRARLGMHRMDLEGHFSLSHAVIAGFELLVDLSACAASAVDVCVQVRAHADGHEPVVIADERYPLDAPTAPPSSPPTVSATRAPSPAPGDPSAPLSLVVFAHDLGYGGAQLWLTEMLRRCGAGRSFSCLVVAPGPGPLAEELKALGIEVHISQPYPSLSKESYEGRLDELVTWLERRDFNAVLVNTFLPFIGADAGDRLGRPFIWAIHESWEPDALWTTFFGAGAFDPRLREVYRQLLGRAGALVFQADATRQLYASSPGSERSVVVPYGIDTSAVLDYCEQTSRAAARSSHQVPDECQVVLVIGTVEPRKCQTAVAAAFERVADDFPDALLVILGAIDTPYTAALRRYVERSALAARVLVLPIVADPSSWYRAADLVLCGSDIESLPRTALEAMCFGVPVAAASVFGLPELLTDGETGYLFEPNDLDALEGALRRALSSDPAELGAVAAAGRRLVLESYGSQRYSDELHLLIEGLRREPDESPTAILARIRQGARQVEG